MALRVTADEHGGWNLHLRIKRFTFAPARVNDRARAQEGHAHLYIGEQKHTRLYSDWFHLPADAVGPGEHKLLVTLNANDHTVWATDGKPITATATVTGSRASHNGGHDHEHDHSAPADGAASPAGTR
ncbi:MAG: hypothetical protein GEU94_02515 [Micromonosporaceae bacterium]|nr:hypothetical protein [Micromonosporaceae bacterium]